MKQPSLSEFARPRMRLKCRVTPNAGRDEITLDEGVIKIRVTASPENGKANDAVRKLLAKSLGIAKTKLHLASGQASRDKTFIIAD